MSLKLPSAPNAGLFKQGYQNYQSEDGAVVRNITACKEISSMVLTSIGPCGRNKIIVNHIGKIFITNDAATMLRELEVVHPAAKLMVMASDQQKAEIGDATNLVIILAGEFLSQAEHLISLGLTTSEIVQGYDLAKNFAVKALNELVIDKVTDFTDVKEISKAIKTAIASKQYGNEEFLAELVSNAILTVLPKNPAAFNVDNIRVVKIMGSSLESSTVIKGMVFGREPEGHIKKVGKSKVAVFTCPIDISATETKGTVLLHSAKEMLNFSKGEEDQIEAAIKEIADSGIKVVIAGSGIGELALHYLNRFGVLVLKVGSKFDLRRICRVVGATPLPRFGAPMPEEMGVVDVVETKEIGGDRVTIFRQENETTRTATIVIRGATQNNLDDVERAIDDGVNALKGITKDSNLLPGAGATEIELVNRITAYGERTPGLLQHAIKKYATAFEIIPRTLAQNAGLDASEALSRLYAAHAKENDIISGVDVDDDSSNGVIDTKHAQIFDLMSSKRSAIELATEAANTILSVDQIIMAKRAGGPVMPKQPQPGNWDQAD